MYGHLDTGHGVCKAHAICAAELQDTCSDEARWLPVLEAMQTRFQQANITKSFVYDTMPCLIRS